MNGTVDAASDAVRLVADALAHVAANANTTTTMTTAATSSAATAATALVPAAPAVCPNFSPFVRRALACPVGSDPYFFAPFYSPAWVVLAHSSQGILALFSWKHLALSFMPTISTWVGKLNTLRTGGRHVRANGADGLAAAFLDENTSAPADAKPSVLPALLAAHPSQHDEMRASSATLRDNRRRSSTPIPSAVASALSSSTAGSASSSSSSVSVPRPRTAHEVLLAQLFTNSSSDVIAQLGSNVFEHILSFLSSRHLASVMSVSRTWYRSANADHLWTALHRRELCTQFMHKDSGLFEVIQGLGEEVAAASASPEGTAAAGDPLDALFVQRRPKRKREWENQLRVHMTKLRHALRKIAITWHADLVAKSSPQQHAALSRSELEAEYLDATHRLTDSISKINAQLAYMKEAVKHARHALQLANGSASSSSASSSSSSSPTPLFDASQENDSTSALLLTACALVQAVHRFCSGTANSKPRQVFHTHVEHRHEEHAHDHDRALAPGDAIDVGSLPADDYSLVPRSSMEFASSVVDEVLQSKDGLRRRRVDRSAEEDSVPNSKPHFTASASSASSSAPPASLSSPPLQRANSSPTPSCSSDHSSCLHSLLPPRRWHSIGDVLQLMEGSGLVAFGFSVSEAIRLHGPKKEKRKPAQKTASAKGAAPALVAAGDETNEPAADAAPFSSASATTAAGSPSPPDDPAGSSDDEDDDSSSSSSSSSFDPAEMNPDAALPVDGEDDDEDADEEGEDAEEEEEEVDGGMQLLPGNDDEQPAPGAHRKPKKIVFLADLDDIGNIFLTTQELPDTPKASSSEASTAMSTALASDAMALTLPADASSSSSSASSLPAELANASVPITSSSSSLVGASSSPPMTLARALEFELAREKAAKAKSPEPPKRPTKSGSSGRAKATYIEAAKFLRVQHSIDQNRREETKLQRNQIQTMRLHETLRQSFKGVILASMIWSLKEQGAVHLLLRYGGLIALIVTIIDLITRDGNEPPHAHGHGHGHHHHGHGHAHGIQLAGWDGNAEPGDGDPLEPPQPAHPIGLFLDFGIFFGLNADLPPLPPANAPVDPDAPPPPPPDPNLAQRKRWRRFALALGIVLLVESFNFAFGRTDPAWFTAVVVATVRFLPLIMFVTQAFLVVGGMNWRSRWFLLWIALTAVLESTFWAIGFQSHNMDSLIEVLGSTVGPRFARFGLILLRISPISFVISAIIFCGITLWTVLSPLILPAPEPGQAQQVVLNWPVIGVVLRAHPQLRHSYLLVVLSVLCTVIAETLFGYFGFDVALPILHDAWVRLKTVAPLLLSLSYEAILFEGRGVLLGAALARFVWVVDQSLPIQSLTILTAAPPLKSKRKMSQPAVEDDEETKEADPDDSASSLDEKEALVRRTSDSPSLSKPSRSSSRASSGSASSGPRVVCLSCRRQSHPFRAIRWLNDLVFETRLFLSYPFTGVQGVLVQRKEQELKLAGDLGDLASDSDVHLQTCVDCTLHSIHCQLVLPFFFCGLVYLFFSRVLPYPTHSTYRQMISSVLHYIFDHTPLLVLIDLAMGWWHARTLRYKRAYVALSTLVLGYATYVCLRAWHRGFGGMLPGFLYHVGFDASSILVLDFAWLAIWTLN